MADLVFRIRIQHLRSIRIRIRIQVFHDQNERNFPVLSFFFMFQSQIALNTYEDVQARVKTIRPSAKWSMLFLTRYLRFSCLDTILTVLDPDPYSQYGSVSRGAISLRIGSTWIRIRNTGRIHQFLPRISWTTYGEMIARFLCLSIAEFIWEFSPQVEFFQH